MSKVSVFMNEEDTEEDVILKSSFENDLLDYFSRSKSLFLEEDEEETGQGESEIYSETSSGSLNEEILIQLQVTNNLLGNILALQIFLLGFGILVFFMKIIQNNVTRHF